MSGKKAFGTYDKFFCMNFWNLSEDHLVNRKNENSSTY